MFTHSLCQKTSGNPNTSAGHWVLSGIYFFGWQPGSLNSLSVHSARTSMARYLKVATSGSNLSRAAQLRVQTLSAGCYRIGARTLASGSKTLCKWPVDSLHYAPMRSGPALSLFDFVGDPGARRRCGRCPQSGLGRRADLLSTEGVEQGVRCARVGAHRYP